MPEIDDEAIDDFYADLGRNVRNARARADMTQDALAKRIGFTRSSVANLEAGRQRVAVHLVILIARTLAIEPATLIPKLAIPGGTDVLDRIHEHLEDSPETSRDFVRGAIAQLAPEAQREESP